MTLQNPSRAAVSRHTPTEIHVTTNGHVGEDSPLAGHACRECSPRELIRGLEDGQLINTDQVVWWPCQHALPQTPT